MMTCVCKHPVVYGGVLHGANEAFAIRAEDEEEMSMVGLVERNEATEDAEKDSPEIIDKPRRGRPPRK